MILTIISIIISHILFIHKFSQSYIISIWMNHIWWNHKFIHMLQCEAPKIAKLVNITPISLRFMVLITIVNGAYKPTYNWGASHCNKYYNIPYVHIHSPAISARFSAGVPLDSTRASASQTRIAIKTLGRRVRRVPGRDQTTDLHGIYIGFT